VIALGAQLPPSGQVRQPPRWQSQQAEEASLTPSGRQPAPRQGRARQPFGRRHRPPWRYLALALALLALLAMATAGFAWYTSSRLIAVTHVHDTYPLRVLAVGSRGTTVTLSDGPDAAEPGTFLLAWPRGQARVGPVTTAGPGFVIRQLSHVSGRLASGERAGIEPDPYTGNPLTALGIPFTTVRVPSPLGGMPAWQVPGRRSTWVILIHGLDGSRADTLPVMPVLHALGFPMLAITYRNDAGAPASPDHHTHLGATEWHDVAAAVRFAANHGASGVVLFGYSLGGDMAAVTAEDSPSRSLVRGLVLDSPVLDWQATLNYQAHRRGIPQPLASLAEALLAWRASLNYAQFDQLRHEASLHVPVLLIQGTADTIVPPAVALAFARARPGIVTYLRVAGADHVAAIDTDPSGYRAALARFLAPYP
jgi:pimeloyl-ACP methyl ester carboxylesterase